MLLSSALFGLAHGWTDATFLHFLAGAVFAISYEKTRALAFPILVHATGNLSNFLLSGLLTEFGHASPA